MDLWAVKKEYSEAAANRGVEIHTGVDPKGHPYAVVGSHICYSCGEIETELERYSRADKYAPKAS